jgi:hypothetical protein
VASRSPERWSRKPEALLLRRFFATLAFFATVLSAALTLFMYGKVREREALVAGFVNESLVGVARADTDAVVHALALSVFHRTNRGLPLSRLPFYDRLEATSFFNVGTGSSLKEGYYGVVDGGAFGPCGTMSRVLLNALWRLEIPARKLQLIALPGSGHITHTMVEYRVGGRWQVISPSDSAFTWRNHSGEVATAEEIRTDPAIFGQIHSYRSAWPADFQNTWHVRWEKLPGPLRRCFRLVLGERGYREAQTPRLYDQPRHFFLYTGIAITLLFGLLGGWLARPLRAQARKTAASVVPVHA